MAFSINAKAQTVTSGQIEEETVVVVVPDTIVRTDTIVIKEVIERKDVVYRTEKVIRYEEKKAGSSETYHNGEPAIVIFEEVVASEPKPEAPVQTPPSSFNYADVMPRQPQDTIIVVNPELFPHPEGAGNYVWVPDSMDSKVKAVLDGNEVLSWKAARQRQEFDPNEKVTFRGDTLPMVLKDRNLGRFDRGLFNFLYIPRGIWQIGLTASYGEFSTEDLEVLDLISDIDFSGHIFSIRPYFAYFIKNNISVGMRLGYSRGQANIGSFNVDIDEDMSFNLHDIMYKSENYTAALTFSQYLGITRRGRFGVYNEVELAFSSGSSDFHRPFGGEMKETHTTTMEAALNFSPGICVYILDQLSFNVSFGVFGLNIQHEKQKENGVYLGSRTTSGANFRFNIFNINFGIAVNI